MRSDNFVMGGLPGNSALAPRDRRRAWTEAVAIGLVVAIAVGAAIAGTWSSSTNTVRENYRQHLISLATAAAQQVDPSLHGLIRRPEQIDGFEYRRAVAPLVRMSKALPEIEHLYTIVRDQGGVRIVLDATAPGDHDRDGVEDRSGVWTLSVSEQTAKQHALGWPGHPPQPYATTEPYTDAWGTFMSGYAPFYDTSGRLAGAAGVDVDARTYVAQLERARGHMLLGLAPAALLILTLTYVIYRLRLRNFAFTRTVKDAAKQAIDSARRDRLTGLANRMAFFECLNAAIERVRSGRQASVAVLFLDFDHFKLVNDTLGHEAGDDLLRQIAGRLRTVLHVSDGLGDHAAGNVVARFGGDEFVVLVNDLGPRRDVTTLAEQLLQVFAPSYDLKGSEVHSSASIGIAVDGAGANDAEQLLRYADAAMYEAKRNGRACYVRFDEAMHARLARRMVIESSLLKAIGTPQLSLAYQPIVELESGRMVSVEALLRWKHPQLGEVPPLELVAIAEESGLIVPLGEWVLHEACRQLMEWRVLYPELAPDTVSVNVSRAELALGARLVERVRNALAVTGLPAECLQLEVAEREVMRDREGSSARLHRLRELGVRLAMDEFGTGSSSLSCLRGYPFDSVKVDRSFVRGLASNGDVMAVIHAALTLVENLGMASIAEGVEHQAQLAILQSLGCRYAQGRLFSEAVPASQVLDAWPNNGRHAHVSAEFAA